MNYIQYINSVYKIQPTDTNFLVSGADVYVRNVLGQYIVNNAYAKGKILFIVDDTQNKSAEFDYFGAFKVVNPLNCSIDLCSDVFNVSSLQGISRLRSLLAILGFESTKAMKVVGYLSFVAETERRIGNDKLLNIETLREYSSVALVNFKLYQLVEEGNLSEDNYRYLLSCYSEVSGAAADFDMFVVMLAPFVNDNYGLSAGTAVYLPIGEFVDDPQMQNVICKLMLDFVKNKPEASSILIIDSANGNREYLADILKSIPTITNIHMLSMDAFSISDEDLDRVMNSFAVRIYSRHESMHSCSKIESCCGNIDVVKYTHTITHDKRFFTSNAFDMLLGRNQTETEIRNAPVQEPRYRKEKIRSFDEGVAIIDCGGIQTLFQFGLKEVPI